MYYKKCFLTVDWKLKEKKVNTTLVLWPHKTILFFCLSFSPICSCIKAAANIFPGTKRVCSDIIDHKMKCVGTACCDDADFCNAQLTPLCDPAKIVIERTKKPLRPYDVDFKRGEMPNKEAFPSLQIIKSSWSALPISNLKEQENQMIFFWIFLNCNLFGISKACGFLIWFLHFFL